MSEQTPEPDPLAAEPDVEPDPEGTEPADESTPEDPNPMPDLGHQAEAVPEVPF